VADRVSHFSRLAGKFFEIVAAGIATAVSGYIVAHLGGFLSSPATTPAAVTPAPSTAVVSKPSHVQPAPPVAADAGEQRPTPAPAPDIKSPAAAPVTTASVPPTAPARKQRSGAVRNVEPADKPRAADTAEKRSTDAAADKPRDNESVEAQIRAALANVDASRPPAETLTRPTANPVAAPPAAALQPKPADIPPGAVASTPRAIEAAPQSVVTQPAVQQTPVQPDALPTVEIKSRPVATVDAEPPGQSAAAGADDGQEDKGPFSALKKILLRAAGPEPADQAPRPPQPVGE